VVHPHETWAEIAKPWTTYLARSSYMLQQGKFVADVAYFYGEDSNITALFGSKSPDVPAGYNFDYRQRRCADPQAYRWKAGGSSPPSGMSYRLLALDSNSRTCRCRCCARFATGERRRRGGGPKPIDSPSLSDDQAEFTPSPTRSGARERAGAPAARARSTPGRRRPRPSPI
jgi:hypothetical protein